jgi:hypothetical protein
VFRKAPLIPVRRKRVMQRDILGDEAEMRNTAPVVNRIPVSLLSTPVSGSVHFTG